ncbi:MAG: glycosyltransferase family 2 protein [Bacteroidales bacterium]|nr:glycosyltransferase family 2 protein [Bacteroidales bacterium]
MDKPLVTVSIITYNSAGTVIETLDSIYAQTYPNIELIISDDCSRDNTLDVCRAWLNTHKLRFENCRLLESGKNTGITANCNRAISDIKGEYLKLLAGDDLLEPNAISEYVSYMLNTPEAIYVFCRIMAFGDNHKKIDLFTNSVIDYAFFSMTREEQYERLIGHWCSTIPAPSAFVNVKAAIDSGVLYYDERIPMLEDWPKWIELSNKGIKFHFIDKQLVRYRINDNSVSTGDNHTHSYRQSIALLYRYYQFKPTIKLYGVRRALTLYIKKNAAANNGAVWDILNSLADHTIHIRNRFSK